MKRGAIPPLHAVEDFMLSLTNTNDGKCAVIIQKIVLQHLVRWTNHIHPFRVSRPGGSRSEVSITESFTQFQGPSRRSTISYPCRRNNVAGKVFKVSQVTSSQLETDIRRCCSALFTPSRRESQKLLLRAYNSGIEPTDFSRKQRTSGR